MINKEICKKCWEESIWHKMIKLAAWTDNNEYCWNIGYINCYMGGYISIDDNPPEKCPFYLEHIVISEK